MDKSTLSNYGWIVIVTLVLSVMLALATPFGSYVARGASNVIKMFVQSSDNAVDKDSISNMSKDWDAYLYNTEEVHEVIIPDGGVYTQTQESVIRSYTKGDNFPAIQIDDTYRYGNYEYKYVGTSNKWRAYPIKGENVTYESPLTYINGEPVVSMVTAFKDFDNNFTLADNFRIPSTVKMMTSIFDGADGLTKLPDGFTIPDSVLLSGNAFRNCVNLEGLPEGFSMSANAINIDYFFYNCKKLTNIPASLKLSPKAAEHHKEVFAYSGITNIPLTFKFPETYRNIECFFYECQNLKDIPSNFEIPTTVTSCNYLFYNCKNLTGTILFNSNAEPYACFQGTVQPITITGTSEFLNEIAATAENGNVTVG